MIELTSNRKVSLLGDEVVEWNGRLLQNKSYEEVYEIIADSRHESQVEIIVTRPIRYEHIISIFCIILKVNGFAEQMSFFLSGTSLSDATPISELHLRYLIEVSIIFSPETLYYAN